MKDERQLQDENTIAKVLAGNTDAFADLVNQYHRLVCHVANGYLKNAEDVDDASQEVFLKAYKALNSYSAEYRFSTWISSITRNHCLDMLRKNSKISTVDIEDLPFLTADTATPEDAFIQTEERHALAIAVASLPETYREVVYLYHGKELSYQDMCDQMDKPMSIVKNRLMRARRMLQKNLAASG